MMYGTTHLWGVSIMDVSVMLNIRTESALLSLTIGIMLGLTKRKKIKMASIKTVAYGKDRAVKLTKNNGQGIADWVNKNKGTADYIADVKKSRDGSQTIKDRVRVKVRGKGWRVAHLGDTIVRVIGAGESDFYVVKAE